VVRSTGAFLVGAGVLALGAVGVGVACNPLFGIEDRSAGPTWCEEDAQSPSIYCDDFDRVSQSTQRDQLQISLGGTVGVTNAESSSAPNSLEAKATGVANTLVGSIASLGPVPPGQGILCQLDVPTADLSALATGTSSVGVFGVGAAESNTGDAIDLLVVFLGPTQETITLERAVSSTGVVQLGMSCPIQGGLSVTQALGGPAGTDNPWVRLTMAVAPTDGGVPEGGCLLGQMAPTMDGGSPKDGGGAAKDGGAVTVWAVRIAAGPLTPGDIYFPAEDFASAAYFIYGLAFQGAGAASTVHVDNARCQLIPSLP